MSKYKRIPKVILGWIVLFFATVAFLSITKVEHFSAALLAPPSSAKIAPFQFPQIEEIASEKLYYLGNGAEAIAFVSADEKYVVKFFIHSRLIAKPRFRPRARISQLLSKKPLLAKVDHVLRRYEQGLHLAPNETAMLAIHRYCSPEILPTCTIVDQEGKHHSIDLNKVAFVVQRRAYPLSKAELRNYGPDIDKQIEELSTNLASKGFVNLSHGFYPPNYATLEGKAIMIDLGKLEYLPEKANQQEEKKLLQKYLERKKNI
jgi:hypothetical protein